MTIGFAAVPCVARIFRVDICTYLSGIVIIESLEEERPNFTWKHKLIRPVWKASRWRTFHRL